MAAASFRSEKSVLLREKCKFRSLFNRSCRYATGCGNGARRSDRRCSSRDLRPPAGRLASPRRCLTSAGAQGWNGQLYL